MTASSPQTASATFRAGLGWTPMAMGMVAASGPDAVRFVDNFTTAAVSRLAVGAGTEGFFTDARGWVLALTTILRTEAGLLLLTATPTLAAALREHLDHYHIREQLTLENVSAKYDGLFVGGPGAPEAVAALCGRPAPSEAAGHTTCRLANCEFWLVRIVGQGPDGYQLLVPAGRGADVGAAMSAAGVPPGDLAALESVRIAAAYPAPADIPPKTLPQELGRDARAISFTKGCYLGQETVARLDALGHVNRRLAAFTIDTPTPPAVPVAIDQQGAEVGMITSACRSPLAGCSLGLGMVQVRALADGGLTIGGAPARPLSREGDA